MSAPEGTWDFRGYMKMSKADLSKAAGVYRNTMTRLRQNEPVILNVLDKKLRHILL